MTSVQDDKVIDDGVLRLPAPVPAPFTGNSHRLLVVDPGYLGLQFGPEQLHTTKYGPVIRNFKPVSVGARALDARAGSLRVCFSRVRFRARRHGSRRTRASSVNPHRASASTSSRSTTC